MSAEMSKLQHSRIRPPSTRNSLHPLILLLDLRRQNLGS